MLHLAMLGAQEIPLAVALEHNQRRIDLNLFPNYRGVFDGDRRSLFRFGGNVPRDYKSPFLYHWSQPHVMVPPGGHVHQRYISDRRVPVERLPFRPYYSE